jgi:hypothetical protein
LPIRLGEAEDQGFELSELKGRVFKAPGASPLDYKPVGSKPGLDQAKRGLEHIPVFQTAKALPFWSSSSLSGPFNGCR